MSEKVKERVIGLLVLLCLAFIFIPPFYDGRNPFNGDDLQHSIDIPRKPNFPSPEKFANELAPIGSGHLAAIEKKVKQSLPVEAVNDSLLDKETSQYYQQKLASFDAGEMTSKLLSDITARSTSNKSLKPSHKLKQVWAVQVASFSESQNAQKLRDRLVRAGFQAYIKTVLKNGLTVSRVFAGTSFEQALAETIRKEIKLKFPEHKAVLVPYIP